MIRDAIHVTGVLLDVLRGTLGTLHTLVGPNATCPSHHLLYLRRRQRRAQRCPARWQSQTFAPRRPSLWWCHQHARWRCQTCHAQTRQRSCVGVFFVVGPRGVQKGGKSFVKCRQRLGDRECVCVCVCDAPPGEAKRAGARNATSPVQRLEGLVSS